MQDSHTTLLPILFALLTGMPTPSVGARGAESPERTWIGTLVEFNERKEELVITVDRHRYQFHADPYVLVTADGEKVRRQWLRPGVPVEVVPAAPPPETPDRRRRRSRRRVDDKEQAVAEVRIQTARATGVVTRVNTSGTFRIRPDRTPATQPVTASAPSTQPARARRAVQPRPGYNRHERRPRERTFIREKNTQIRKQGKSTLFSKVRDGEYVEVTYIPGDREPAALTIDILREVDRRAHRPVRVELRPVGTDKKGNEPKGKSRE